MDDLHGRVTDCSKNGFLHAMDISCHSFIRLAQRAEKLMSDGGSLITVSYHGANKVMGNYGLMGPVKAALESTTRYLAAELGSKNITVNAISAGPVATRAASGIKNFDTLMADANQKSPAKRMVSLKELGALASFLASDGATGITGGVHYCDAGLNIMG